MGTACRVVVRFTSGGCGVVGFSEKPLPWTDERIAASLAKTYHPANRFQVASWRRIELSDIPEDQYFREAWRDGGQGPIAIDMPAAREIQRDNIRLARQPLLEALDTEYMRADESGDQAQKRNIVAQKAALRDVTDDPAIEAAQTPAELRAIWPAVLGPR